MSDKVVKVTFTFYIDDPKIVQAVEKNEDTEDDDFDTRMTEMCLEELAQWENEPTSYAQYEIVERRM